MTCSFSWHHHLLFMLSGDRETGPGPETWESVFWDCWQSSLPWSQSFWPLSTTSLFLPCFWMELIPWMPKENTWWSSMLCPGAGDSPQIQVSIWLNLYDCQVPAISRRSRSWLHPLQDEGAAQTSLQPNGFVLDLSDCLPGWLPGHLRTGPLPEGQHLGCLPGREDAIWRLPQAGLGLGPLLGDPGLHQRSRRPCKQHPLLASLGAPGQDELCHLPGPHDCHECGEQLCQLQGECQPGTDGWIAVFVPFCLF